MIGPTGVRFRRKYDARGNYKRRRSAVVQVICLILSVIFAALSAASIPEPPRFRFLSVAIAFLALALLVGWLPGMGVRYAP